MKIMMAGMGTFAEPIFESLIQFSPIGLITQPDSLILSKRGSTRQNGKGMKSIAESKKIPVYQPENVNSPEFIKIIKEINPDLIVVAAYGQIFSKEFLDSCKLMVNAHASLLPKYRGSSPVAHAILNGDGETGCTIIKIDSGIDSGDIHSRSSINIEMEDTTGTLETKISIAGSHLICDLVKKMISNEPVVFTKQNLELASKAPRIKKEFGLIDWKKPADYICRHIRAMQPWPTAYTLSHQIDKAPQRVCIVEAIKTKESSIEEWGKVVVHQGRLLVATDDNFVEIIKIHPSGKKLMDSSDYLRGIQKSNKLVKFGIE